MQNAYFWFANDLPELGLLVRTRAVYDADATLFSRTSTYYPQLTTHNIALPWLY